MQSNKMSQKDRKQQKTATRFQTDTRSLNEDTNWLQTVRKTLMNNMWLKNVNGVKKAENDRKQIKA